MKIKFFAIIIGILLSLTNSFEAQSQCSQDVIYKKITETAKSDTLILLREFIIDENSPENNSWTISLKDNTEYKIYLFTENKKDQITLYKILKKEKIAVKTISGEDLKNYIKISTENKGASQILLNKTDNKNCVFGAIYFSKKI
jgi:hypothetical protein